MESSPLSCLTGRDRYLVVTALAVAIAMLDRMAGENWRASTQADMKQLLATMADDENTLDSMLVAGNGLVERVLSGVQPQAMGPGHDWGD